MRAQHVWLLLLGLVPLSLGLQLWQKARVATPEDLACAAQLIREGFEAGDVLRFEPFWAYEAWPLLKELPVDRVRRLEPRRMEPYKRLWILGSMGQQQLGALPAGFVAEESRSCGEATVHRVKLPYRGEASYDFTEQLKGAQVERVYDGHGRLPTLAPGGPGWRDWPRRQRCRRWSRGRWYCGAGHAWKWVGPITRDVDDSPRSGIWAHPLPGAHKLDISYPKVTLGRELQIEGGLTLRAINAREGAPVHFEVWVGGSQLLDAQILPWQKGWFEWSLDTKAWAGQTKQVRFRVWTDDDEVRQWIFAGRVWP